MTLKKKSCSYYFKLGNFQTSHLPKATHWLSWFSQPLPELRRVPWQGNILAKTALWVTLATWYLSWVDQNTMPSKPKSKRNRTILEMFFRKILRTPTTIWLLRACFLWNFSGTIPKGKCLFSEDITQFLTWYALRSPVILLHCSTNHAVIIEQINILAEHLETSPEHLWTRHK